MPLYDSGAPRLTASEVQDYVEKCPSQMYCCAENGPDCCSREDDPDIVFQLEEPSITATALIPSETDVSADGDATGKNPVVIGLGVGVPCSLMILGAAGFFLWRCRAKRREELSKKQPEIMPTQEEHGPHRQPEDAAPPYESTGAAEPIPAPPATVTQENQNGLLGNAKPMTAGVKEAVNAAGRVQDSRQHETTPNTVFEAPDNVVAPGNRFELG
ncbi:MAG: hypothetical protein M1831_005327 [Alyxoria varia]|nr:MAG: hypothetical protein M1831_005327 [Alyxoria varia]